MQKYLSIIAGITVQMCLGGIYAFSAYIPALQKEFGYSSAEGQAIFGCAITAMTLIMLIAGRNYRRLGPRLLIIICGVLFLGGHLAAMSWGRTFLPLFLFYVMLVGGGAGFGYVCPIVVGIGWFPRRKGLITGLTVAGYGAGGVVLSFVVEILLSHVDSVLTVFGYVGLIYGAVIILCGLIITPPPAKKVMDVPEISYSSLLRHSSFYALSAGVMFGTLPGLMIIGNLKPIGLFYGFSPSLAISAVMTLSVGNAVGRLFWGHIHDHHQPRRIAIAIFITVLLSVMLIFFANGLATLFLVSSFCIGLSYGGNLAIYPSQTALIFHAENVARIYPMVMLTHGLAGGVGATVGGYLKDISGSFDLTFITAASFGLIGLVLYALLSRKESALR